MTKNDTPQPAHHSSARRFVMRWPVQLFIMPLFYALALFIAAGTLDWPWAWIFTAFYLLSSLLILLVVRDPDLIAERENPPAGVQQWDRRMLGLYSQAMVLTLIVAGLNERYGWLPAVPLVIHLLGLLGLTATVILGAWSMRVNTYFSAYVRIQTDRNQVVIDRGPYRFIRHPGNLSMILWALGAALALGSGWALIPAVLASGLVIQRTSREDATLQAELPGYQDYTRRVRHRLLPGVW